MNFNIQSLKDFEAYGACGAIRVTLMGLLLLNISLASYAQSQAGLASSDELSTFSEVELQSDVTSVGRYAAMEALWEMDMSQAGNGDGRNDPNQNNHNLFVIDNIVYVYVEKYQAPGETITLRRFDATTGEELPDLHSDFSGELTNALLQRYVMSDEAGHIAVVGLKALSTDKKISMIIQVYDSDFELITTITPSFEEAEEGHHSLVNYEWLGITGDLLSGDFSLSIGCWHSWGDTHTENFYYPSDCRMVFSKGSATPDIEVTRYDSGEYILETRSGSSSTGTPWKGMLFVSEVDDNYHLVQGFGTTAAPTTHSPVMLYKDNGELHSSFASEPYRMLNQTELLTDPEFAFSDPHCFGAFPVNVGDEKMLVLPYSRNGNDGVRFKIAHWGNPTTFSSLKSLWEFPENSDSCPTTIYETLRPKVVSIPSAATDMDGDKISRSAQSPRQQTTFFAYMPGSLLGAYRVTIDDKPIASGMVGDKLAGQDRPYTISGRDLYVDSDKEAVSLSVASTTGCSVINADIRQGASGHIPLQELPSGVYVLTLNGNSYKIFLR